MSERTRRTKIVYDAVVALREQGASAFLPGDVTAHLRAAGTPFGAWEVRGELSNLERLGLVELDEDSASWRCVNGAAFSIEEAGRLWVEECWQW